MGKHILVVDDDRPLRSFLRELLESEMYEVDLAADGLDALEKLDYQYHIYDVILLDMTMPRMNGLQLLREIQQRGLIVFSSIIAISGDVDALHQATCMGISSSLSKPFDSDMLLDLVALSSTS